MLFSLIYKPKIQKRVNVVGFQLERGFEFLNCSCFIALLGGDQAAIVVELRRIWCDG